MAPENISLKEDLSASIVIEQESAGEEACSAPARRVSFMSWGFLKDRSQIRTTCPLQTCRVARHRGADTNPEQEPASPDSANAAASNDIPEQTQRQREGTRANIHVKFEDTLLKKWLEGYQTSPTLKQIYDDPRSQQDAEWTLGYRYFKDESALLYFLDADHNPHLCVPESFRLPLIVQAHESASETAHCSMEKLWQKLTLRFYWRRMKADLVNFCHSCDICQKTKSSTFNKWGYLWPNAILDSPYSSISMDFIVHLPMSNGYNAIFVVVDRLSKHANFIPMSTGLSAKEFGILFVKKITSKFGIPENIICDCDPRWTSDFWKAVVKALNSRMLLSSSHHPQTDGQTEIVNRFLETMI